MSENKETEAARFMRKIDEFALDQLKGQPDKQAAYLAHRKQMHDEHVAQYKFGNVVETPEIIEESEGLYIPKSISIGLGDGYLVIGPSHYGNAYRPIELLGTEEEWHIVCYSDGDGPVEEYGKCTDEKSARLLIERLRYSLQEYD